MYSNGNIHLKKAQVSRLQLVLFNFIVESSGVCVEKGGDILVEGQALEWWFAGEAGLGAGESRRGGVAAACPELRLLEALAAREQEVEPRYHLASCGSQCLSKMPGRIQFVTHIVELTDCIEYFCHF